MATKSKTAAKKPAVRKSVATHHKPPPAKGKVSKEKVKEHPKPVHPHTPAHAKAPAHRAEEKSHAKQTTVHRPSVESVSLIDKKHPEKKAADGEIKKKTTVLPPISRIRASLEATAAPPPKPKAAEPAAPPKSTTDGEKVDTAPVEAEAPPQKVTHIKPP